jgi:hypothetical protein
MINKIFRATPALEVVAWQRVKIYRRPAAACTIASLNLISQTIGTPKRSCCVYDGLMGIVLMPERRATNIDTYGVCGCIQIG